VHQGGPLGRRTGSRRQGRPGHARQQQHHGHENPRHRPCRPTRPKPALSCIAILQTGFHWIQDVDFA
jgi:hypothetical protein